MSKVVCIYPEDLTTAFLRPLCNHICSTFNAVEVGYDTSIDDDLVFSGNMKLTDSVPGVPLDAGKLVLSPTRTYAPIVKELIEAMRGDIHGMIHCSGGALTKVLHFIDDLHVVKDNLFDTPPLFKLIQEQSGTPWKEMYSVFNMGQRLEVYVNEEKADMVMSIASKYGVESKIIGHCEKYSGKKVTVKSAYGIFEY